MGMIIIEVKIAALDERRYTEANKTIPINNQEKRYRVESGLLKNDSKAIKVDKRAYMERYDG
jgi:hypothetical protein